jgi:hypothetical protein
MSASVRFGGSTRFKIYQRPDGESVVVDVKTGQRWYCGSLGSARKIQAHLEALGTLTARH